MTISRNLLFTALCLCAGWMQPQAYAQQQQPSVTVQEQPKVNINEADAAALSKALRGVGPRRAQRIVHYRETHGPFESLEELTQVRGIGKRVLQWNKERIILE